MDKNNEIRHRWLKAFSQVFVDKQIEAVKEINPLEIISDIKFFRDRVDQLEKDLADALCPISSGMGALIEMKDGVLYYRIRGMFVKLETIYKALEFLLSLKKSEKFAKRLDREATKMLEEITEVFNDPPCIKGLDEESIDELYKDQEQDS